MLAKDRLTEYEYVPAWTQQSTWVYLHAADFLGEVYAELPEDERPDFWIKVRAGSQEEIREEFYKAIYVSEDPLTYEDIGDTRLSTEVILHQIGWYNPDLAINADDPSLPINPVFDSRSPLYNEDEYRAQYFQTGYQKPGAGWEPLYFYEYVDGQRQTVLTDAASRDYQGFEVILSDGTRAYAYTDAFDGSDADNEGIPVWVYAQRPDPDDTDGQLNGVFEVREIQKFVGNYGDYLDTYRDLIGEHWSDWYYNSTPYLPGQWVGDSYIDTYEDEVIGGNSWPLPPEWRIRYHFIDYTAPYAHYSEPYDHFESMYVQVPVTDWLNGDADEDIDWRSANSTSAKTADRYDINWHDGNYVFRANNDHLGNYSDWVADQDFGEGAGGWIVQNQPLESGATWDVDTSARYHANGAGNSYSVYDEWSGSDYTIEGDVLNSRWSGSNFAGIVFRYKDADNFYAALLQNNALRVYRRQGGTWTELGSYATVPA
jgi:hypothetical protein